MTSVQLTDEELTVLDGKCGERAQVSVDAAKRRIETRGRLTSLAPNEAGFIADVVNHASCAGVLIYRHERITSCPVCKKRAGYAKYTRNTRWHTKGEDNRKRRLSFHAIEMAKAFIRFRGSVTLGCCVECLEKVKDALATELLGVKAEMPKALTGVDPKWKRYDRRKCPECGWEGSERKMRRSQCLMGHGTYPSTCPSCSYCSPPMFGKSFKTLGGCDIAAVDTEATQ